MAHRDHIAVFYSSRNEKDFEMVLPILKQLGVISRNNVRELRVDAVDVNENTDSTSIRRVLTRARMVVLMECPDFFSSELMCEVEEFVEFLDTVKTYAEVAIRRIELSPVAEFLPPPLLREFEIGVTDLKDPLEPLVSYDGARLNAARKTVIDKLVAEYIAWKPVELENDFGTREVPFIIDRGDLCNPITLFPGRIKEWSNSSEFAFLSSELPGKKLDEPLRRWMESFGPEAKKLPPWDLDIPQKVPVELENANPTFCDCLEQISARLYPRYRDAQIELYACVNDSRVAYLKESVAEHFTGRAATLLRTKNQLRSQAERKRHIRATMTSLLRKHGEFGRAVEELVGEFGEIEKLSPELAEFVSVWKSIPLCELGILQRLDHACTSGYVNHSLNQCLQLLDRVSVWLHTTNRLFNLVPSQL